jgi:hypothetical protein
MEIWIFGRVMDWEVLFKLKWIRRSLFIVPISLMRRAQINSNIYEKTSKLSGVQTLFYSQNMMDKYQCKAFLIATFYHIAMCNIFKLFNI